MNQLGQRLVDLLTWGVRTENPKWPRDKRIAWRRLVYAGLTVPQSTFYRWLQDHHVPYEPRGVARNALGRAKLLVMNPNDDRWSIDEEAFIAFAHAAFGRVAQDYVVVEGGDPCDLNHPVYVAQRQMLARAGFIQSDLPPSARPRKRHAKALVRGVFNLGTRLEVNAQARWLPFANPASSYYWLHRFKIKRHELRANLGMAAKWATQTRDWIDIANPDHIRWLYDLQGFEAFCRQANEEQIRWLMVKVMADKLLIGIDDWPTERERFDRAMARVKEHALQLLESSAWAEMAPAKLAAWLEEPEERKLEIESEEIAYAG